MSKSKTFGNVLVFLVVIAVIFLGYKYFIAGSSDETGEAGAGQAMPSASSETADEFMGILNGLNSVNLSATKFLDDPVFAESLKDFSGQLPVISAGRENPFAAIGTGGGAPARAVASSSSRASKTGTSTGNLNLGTQEQQF